MEVRGGRHVEAGGVEVRGVGGAVGVYGIGLRFEMRLWGSEPIGGGRDNDSDNGAAGTDRQDRPGDLG